MLLCCLLLALARAVCAAIHAAVSASSAAALVRRRSFSESVARAFSSSSAFRAATFFCEAPQARGGVQPQQTVARRRGCVRQAEGHARARVRA